MQRVIREKFCNHTILSVAHKLDTILDYDRVVVLDAGRVVESGEPFALLTDPKSHFSRLYASSMVTEDSDFISCTAPSKSLVREQFLSALNLAC